MKRSICIFSDPTQLISRKSMQPNHQTKTHRPNLKYKPWTTFLLGIRHPFIPLSGMRIIANFHRETNNNPP